MERLTGTRSADSRSSRAAGRLLSAAVSMIETEHLISGFFPLAPRGPPTKVPEQFSVRSESSCSGAGAAAERFRRSLGGDARKHGMLHEKHMQHARYHTVSPFQNIFKKAPEKTSEFHRSACRGTMFPRINARSRAGAGGRSSGWNRRRRRCGP